MQSICEPTFRKNVTLPFSVSKISRARIHSVSRWLGLSTSHLGFFHNVSGKNIITLLSFWTASVVYWSEFLATDPETRVRFPALPDFLKSSLDRGPLSLVSTSEELLGRKSSGSGSKSRDYGRMESSG
jgi:hypothetical protein